MLLSNFTNRVRRAALSMFQPGRRFNCPDQMNPSWALRAEAAVRLLGTSIVHIREEGRRLAIGDFACGNERVRPLLERELGPTFDYQGYDLHPQSPTVCRIDLSRNLPERSFDAVFCLGIVEYLPDVPAFAARLREVCRLAVVSYAIAHGREGLSPAERKARGWMNHFGRADLEAIFVRAGFFPVDFLLTNSGRTGLWLWSTGAGQLERPRATPKGYQ